LEPNRVYIFAIFLKIKGILGSKTMISVKVALNERKTMMYATPSKPYSVKRYTSYYPSTTPHSKKT